MSDRMRDIDTAVAIAEQDGRVQSYYRSAPGDCGIRHHAVVRCVDNYAYSLVCNTRAMYLLARSILCDEPLTWGFVSALRYVR